MANCNEELINNNNNCFGDCEDQQCCSDIIKSICVKDIPTDTDLQTIVSRVYSNFNTQSIGGINSETTVETIARILTRLVELNGLILNAGGIDTYGCYGYEWASPVAYATAGIATFTSTITAGTNVTVNTGAGTITVSESGIYEVSLHGSIILEPNNGSSTAQIELRKDGVSAGKFFERFVDDRLNPTATFDYSGTIIISVTTGEVLTVALNHTDNTFGDGLLIYNQYGTVTFKKIA